MMDLFELKYVYLDWNDKLEGKKCFVANDIKALKRRVNNTKSLAVLVKKNESSDDYLSFETERPEGPEYSSLAYYDPNYEQKIAYSQGKKIQSRHGEFDEWEDCEMPSWYEDYDYRVKPEYIWFVWQDEHKQMRVTLEKDLPKCADPFIRGTRQECADYANERFCVRCKRKTDGYCNVIDDECDGFLEDSEKTCGICGYRADPDKDKICRSCGEKRDNWKPDDKPDETWYVWEDLNREIRVTLRQNLAAYAEFFLRGTEQECKGYAVKRFCKRCKKEGGSCYIGGCDGYEKDEKKACGGCDYIANFDFMEPCYSCNLEQKSQASDRKNSASEKDCPRNIVGSGKKKRLMTNRELARWLSEGKGQVLAFGNIGLIWTYAEEQDNEEIKEAVVKIRGWDETDWHEPEVEE